MKKLTKNQEVALHEFYKACRKLVSDNIVPVRCIQRSFEEALAGVVGHKTWRPSHISHAAAQEVIEGKHRSVQRAHGVYQNRLDRYDRTVNILSGPELNFKDWWNFFLLHDATVLITKNEHNQNVKFEEKDLIPIPDDERNLFVNGGFSFKVRKKFEVEWLKSL